MKARQEVLYPLHGQDEDVIRVEEWVPNKQLIEEINRFGVFRSDPKESPSGNIQYAVRSAEEDLIRIDSYSDGFFAVNWKSETSLNDFLQAVEGYFAQFEKTLAFPERELTLGVFAPFHEPEFFTFERPLLVADLDESEITKSIGLEGISLLRIDSDTGSFTYEPSDGALGFVSPLKFTNQGTLRKALFTFILRLQNIVPDNVVNRTIRIVQNDANQSLDGNS